MISGLKKIEFFFSDRCVRQIEWNGRKDKKTGHEYGMWIHRSADWWDNCAYPEWLKYRASREKKSYEG